MIWHRIPLDTSEWLRQDEAVYEACQVYRHAPLSVQSEVVVAYVKMLETIVTRIKQRENYVR